MSARRRRSEGGAAPRPRTPRRGAVPRAASPGEAAGEAGFTFVEVMVSLVLASLLGVALLGGLRSGQNLIGRATRDAARTARLVQLEALVRRGARQVRIPYWVREVEVGRGEDWLAVPYRRGEPSDRLVLRRRDGRLLIGGEGGTAGGGTGAGPAGGAAGGGAGSAGGTTAAAGSGTGAAGAPAEQPAALGPFTAVAFELESGPDGRPWGVRVTVQDGAAEPVSVVACFGSASGL